MDLLISGQADGVSTSGSRRSSIGSGQHHLSAESQPAARSLSPGALAEQKLWKTLEAQQEDLQAQLAALQTSQAAVKQQPQSIVHPSSTMSSTGEDTKKTHEMEDLLRLAEEKAQEQQQLLEEARQAAIADQERLQRQEVERSERRQRKQERQEQEEADQARWRAIEEERLRQAEAEEIEEEAQRQHSILVARVSIDILDNEDLLGSRHMSEGSVSASNSSMAEHSEHRAVEQHDSTDSLLQTGSKPTPQWLLDELDEHRKSVEESDLPSPVQPYSSISALQLGMSTGKSSPAPARPSPPGARASPSLQARASPAQNRTSQRQARPLPTPPSSHEGTPPRRSSPPMSRSSPPQLLRRHSRNGSVSSGSNGAVPTGETRVIMCVVCSLHLTPASAIVYASRPHCQFCYSTNEGKQTVAGQCCRLYYEQPSLRR